MSEASLALVATDLDGTLLDSGHHVNAWTRSVLDACRDRGVLVVPVTARQPRGLAPIAAEAGMDERADNAWALCCNGALATNLVTGEVLFERLLGTDAAAVLVERLADELPDVRVVGVRDRGETFLAQAGYAELATFTDHHRDPAGIGSAELGEILAAPNLKLVLRHPTLPPAELLRRVEALALPGIEATTSGASFVEVSADGVTKGAGLAELCAHLGIPAERVVAFGDAHNDLAMLRWAGTSYAMRDCDERLLDVVDARIGSNDDDGVARTLMELMRAGRL